MSTTEIHYQGHTAIPSDHETSDGTLALALGAIPHDGALRPISLPTTLPLPLLHGGYDADTDANIHDTVIFLHTTAAYTHYILRRRRIPTQDDALPLPDELHYIDRDKRNATHLIDQDIHPDTISAVGNTLLVLTSTGIRHFIFRDGDYKPLGSHLPHLQLSIGLVGHPKSYYGKQKQYIQCSYHHHSDDNPIGGNHLAHQTINEKDQSRVTQTIFAALNKFLSEETVQKGRHAFPFFIRYALRLYDGTLTHHSAPILLTPSITHGVVVDMPRYPEDNGLFDLFLIAADIDYQVIADTAIAELNQWRDLVRSVDFFITTPIYTHDQSGTIKQFSQGRPDMDRFIGRYDPETNRAPLDITPTGGHYAEWDTNVIYALEKGRHGVDPYVPIRATLHLPEVDTSTDRLTSHFNFYHLASIPIDQLARDHRDIIKVSSDHLAALTTRETLPDDYLSHDTLCPEVAFTYNARINLAAGARRPFRGFYPQAAFAYTNAILTVVPASGQSQVAPKAVDLRFTPAADRPTLTIYLKEDGRTYALSSGIADTSIAPLINPTLTTLGINSPLTAACTFFFYPNPAAYKAVITDSQGRRRTLPLKPHPYLNGAYASLPSPGLRIAEGWTWEHTERDHEDNYAPIPGYVHSHPDEDTAIVVTDTSGFIPTPNKLLTSEVNNPFYFPLTARNTIGTGRIIALSSAARPLSQGQFGQFPLYAFTTDGIWALELTPTGTYAAKQPISREVCLHPDSVTQTDTAVLFATQRGIMHLSGINITPLTPAINTDHPLSLAALTGTHRLLQIYNLRAVTHLTASDLTPLPFSRFLREARTIYDYTHQRIFLYNPQHPLAYIYDIASQAWGMFHSDIASHPVAYPDALACTHDGHLVDFSHPSATDTQPTIIITRPLKLDLPHIHKTIQSVIQRGDFRTDPDTYPLAQALYGSNDLRHWHLVWTSANQYLRGFRGTPYQYFRLAVIAHFTPDQSLHSCTITHTPRYTNQAR